MRILFVACVGVVLSGAARADTSDDEWTRIAHDRLFTIQVELARGHAAEALLRAEALLADTRDVTAPERMWLNIYRGCSLDRASKRASAAEAFRTALAIHEHPVARRGLTQAVPTLSHLERLKAELGDDSVESGGIVVGSGTVHWIALVPPGKKHPAVIRIGHPQDDDGLGWALVSLRAADGVPREDILVTTDVLPGVMRGRKLVVDDPELLRAVPPRFVAVVDELSRKLPIDSRQVYLTGISFDGVWAWILGLETPERFAGVLAFSAVSYPNAISGRLERGKQLPVCVLRGELDHMFPARLEQEKRTATEMIRINPQSQWHLLPGITHTQVWEHAGICFHALLARPQRAQ